MHTRYYLIGLFIATFLAWASWVVVVNNLSPFVSGYLALSFFYASFMIALTGSFSLVIYYLKAIFSDHHQNGLRVLNASLRQGSLLSLMICIGLIFQRLRVLTWWDAALLLVIILLLEYYFAREA